MRRLLQRIASSALGPARVYFALFSGLLGISSGFVLSLATIWTRQLREFPGSNFLFIGGNMLFWSILVSVLMNVPLASLGSLLLRDRAEVWNRFGLGRRHIAAMVGAQMWRPVAFAFLIAVILYAPISYLLGLIPDDVGGRLIDVDGWSWPAPLAILLAGLSLVLPAVTALFVLTLSVVKTASARSSEKKKYASYSVLALAVATVLVISAYAFYRPNQAGILLTLALILAGVLVVSFLGPRVVVVVLRWSGSVFGRGSVFTVAQSLSYEYRRRFSGVSIFVFLMTSIPSLIFTASSIQAMAEGFGGVQRWDFWILFSTPIGLVLMATVSVLVVLAQLMNESSYNFRAAGVSGLHRRVSIYAVIVMLTSAALVITAVGVGILSTAMAYLWDVGVLEAIRQIYWEPIVVIWFAIAAVVPVLYAMVTPSGNPGVEPAPDVAGSSRA